MISSYLIGTNLRQSFRIFVGFFSILILLMPLTSCTGVIAETPSYVFTTPKAYYIDIEDLGDASQYWNTDWRGRPSELYDEILALTIPYFQTHRYVFGETDCNDMAVDAWQELLNREIISLIAVGNLEKSYESFLECNHAWLIVYNGEGSAAVIDLVRGKVYVWEDIRANPQLRQYWEGFVYENPSDLFTDFKERW